MPFAKMLAGIDETGRLDRVKPLCLLIFPLVTVAMFGFVSSVMAYRWLGQAQHASEIDRSARILVYLLLLAILSLGAFLMYIFLHVRAC